MIAHAKQKGQSQITTSLRGADRRRTPGWPLLPLRGNSPSGNLLVLRTNLQHSTRRLPRPDGARNDMVVGGWSFGFSCAVIEGGRRCHPPYSSVIRLCGSKRKQELARKRGFLFSGQWGIINYKFIITNYKCGSRAESEKSVRHAALTRSAQFVICNL